MPKQPLALVPPESLVRKLGAIVDHVEKVTNTRTHAHFSYYNMRTVLADPEVKEWLDQMGKLAMLPVKRK